MHFVVIMRDKPDHLPVRLANREAHLAWAAEHRDVILAGGPFLDDAGRMTGSMLIAEAPSKDWLAAFLAEDPYARAGLFASTAIEPWRWVVGAPS